MSITPDIATIAALIADPSRAKMLSVLLGGHALPAGELAECARISAQTASSHLAKLVEGGLLSVAKTGRHRYYYLRSKEVAHALEALALIAPAAQVRSLNQRLEGQAICQARTCYDHLAGRLGVLVTQAMVDKQIIFQHDETFEVTPQGLDWLTTIGVDCEALHKQRRTFAAVCIDWSERKPHIAGALGAAIAQRLFQMQWIDRLDQSRAVRVTEHGRTMLEQELSIRV